MPADASIYGQIQPVRPRNALADFADVMQIQGLQQRAQLGQMQMDEARRARSQEEALAGAYRNALAPDGTINRNALFSGVAGAGLGHKLPGIQKGFADSDKAAAEAKGKLLENTKRRVELSGQAFGFVRSAPTLENANSALNFLEQNEILDAPTAAKYRAQITADPSSIPALAEQAFRAALDAKEQLAKIETRDMGGAVQTLATDPVTMRQTVLGTVAKTATPGDLLADKRAGQRIAEQARHNKTMEGFRESEVGGVQYVTDAAGNTIALPKKAGSWPIQAIPVIGEDGKPLSKGAGGKPLTDAQAKANLFGTRMQEAHRILNELEDKGVTRPGNIKSSTEAVLGLTPFMGDKMADIGGTLTHWTQSSEQKRVEQARRDFINAVLRRESGAVISEAEFVNAEKQYFPQPNDGPKELAQKRRARELAIRGMEAEVPGGFRTEATPPPPAASEPAAPTAFADPGKESRYQEWKRRQQGGK